MELSQIKAHHLRPDPERNLRRQRDDGSGFRE